MAEWKRVKIGDFLTERSGRYKPGAKEILPYKRLDKIDFSGTIHLSEKDTKTDMILVCPGDLVISGINVAKGAITVYRGEEPITATIHYSSYTFNDEKIDLNFFKWFVKSEAFTDAIKRQVKGGIKTEIKAKTLLSLEISIPERISDQKKIVAEIESHVEKIDQISREIAKQKNYVKQLRQSVLQDAIEGKLTEDWRKKHPVIKGDINYDAEALYNHIQQEKQNLIAAGKIKKEKPLPEIKVEEKLFDIPKSWNWLRLGCVCFSTMAGTSFACEHRITEGNEWGVIKTSAITSGEFLESENKVYSRTTPEDVSARIYEGDFLFCRASGSKGLAGTSCIVRKISLNLLLSDKSIRLDLSKKVNLNFVQKLNNSFWGERYRLSLGTAKSTSMNNVTRDQILGFYFPFPPLAEQNEIVHRVECALKKIDELEQQITTRETDAKTLLQTTLHTTFQEG